MINILDERESNNIAIKVILQIKDETISDEEYKPADFIKIKKVIAGIISSNANANTPSDGAKSNIVYIFFKSDGCGALLKKL